jgi:hypothetical protein
MPTMTFPADIPAITVEGTPITEEAFPRRKQRRFSPDPDCSDVPDYCKKHEDHLDYSVDMHRVLEDKEHVIGASAWSNAPEELIVTYVRYGQKGALVFVSQGTENTCYLITLLVRTDRGRVFTYRMSIRVSCHEFATLQNYEAPFTPGESCNCHCNFYVDLLDEYVGPFYYDADAEPLFACVPADDPGAGGGSGV